MLKMRKHLSRKGKMKKITRYENKKLKKLEMGERSQYKEKKVMINFRTKFMFEQIV